MADPCLNPAPEIALSITDTPNSGGLTAELVPSAILGNGVQLLDDGVWVPAHYDMVGGGFPGVPPDPNTPADFIVKTSPFANVSWTFRYNPLSSSAYPWEFIGGPAAYVSVETQGSLSQADTGAGSFGSWVDFHATDVRGPDFVVPFSGVYLVDFGARMNADQQREAQAGIDTIAGASPGLGSIVTAPGTPGNNFASVSRRQQVTMQGGDTWRMFFRATGTSMDGDHRWMSVTPMRCSGARGSTYGGT